MIDPDPGIREVFRHAMYQLIHPSSVVQIPEDLSGTGPARIKPRASRYGRWGRLKCTVSLLVYFEMERPIPRPRYHGLGMVCLCFSIQIYLVQLLTPRRRVHPQMPFSQLPLKLSQVSTLSTSLYFYICSPPPQSVVTEQISNISQNQMKSLSISLSTHFAKSNSNIMFITFFVLATVILIDFRELTKLISAGSLTGQVAEN
ncbi:hypothetical protein MJO29_001909, partial [Puccinia striiformis f. sp. tritici]